MRTSKYQPWTDYLQNHPDIFCRISFSDIERLIGDNLPDTCKTYATVFWNNSNGHYRRCRTAGVQISRSDFYIEIGVARC